MRTQHSLWKKLLEEQFDVEIKSIATNMKATKANFDAKVKPHLESGAGLITTIGSHIVSIQGYNDEGVTVDDPNGALIKDGESTNLIKKRYDDGDVYKQFSTRNTSSSNSKKGENNLWKWDDIKDIKLLYIKSLKKK